MAMEIRFRKIEGTSTAYRVSLVVLAVLVLLGLWSTFQMMEHGLYLSGMNQRVPWGLQIIMAVFYIGLSAGSLIVSGLYGVFGKIDYKPFARLAAYIAMLFLIAGLLSILTDQGRMDRVFKEPFHHFNLRSMFSINPSLYSGHIALCVLYLYALFKEKPRLTKFAAVTVVCWAIAVHSGTAMIFGFVPRELYQSPLLPASFVAAALASGAGFMIVLLHVLFRATGRRLDDGLLIWLGKLMRVFIIVVCYLILVENLHRYYLMESRDAALHFLFVGTHGVLFWIGMLVIGFVIPLVILYGRWGSRVKWVVRAGALVVFGVLCERYIIVLPGLSHPPDLFPGMTIVASPFNEGVASYSVSGYETLQALGVFGAVSLLFLLGIKYMGLVPTEARVLTETREIMLEEEESRVGANRLRNPEGAGASG
jgi:molybdopterin-containing oxidoreductase family membrane subunit